MITRYYIDTEFIERPGVLQLISLGITDERGRDFYAVSSEFDETQANDFVREQVLPKLGTIHRETHAQIKQRLLKFVDDDQPEFWGYFADYDWVLFCWILGTMMDLPAGWPMHCLDVKQIMHEHGIMREQLPDLPPGQAHNALADARWTRSAHMIVNALTKKKRKARK